MTLTETCAPSTSPRGIGRVDGKLLWVPKRPTSFNPSKYVEGFCLTKFVRNFPVELIVKRLELWF